MKLLIVDDEPLLKDKLAQIFSSPSLGIHTLFATDDPEEAMSLLESKKPEILITDIRMPHISGIDMARYIYDNQLDTIVIFISGYSDFEYAKSAIDYQVFDYLLKPVDPKEALACVKRAINHILEKQKHNEMYQIFQNYFSTHFDLARRQFLERLLFHPITISHAQLKEMQQQFHITASTYILFAFSFSVQNLYSEEEFYYTYAIDQFLNRKYDSLLTYPFGKTVYVLYGSEDKDKDSDKLLQLVWSIKNEMELNYPIRIYVGISNPTDDLSKIQILRKQVSSCQEYALQQKNNSIVFFGDLPAAFNKNEYFNIIDFITQLIGFVRRGDKNAVDDLVDSIVKRLCEKPEGYISDSIDLMISNILLFIYELPLPSTEKEKIQNNILTNIHQQKEMTLKLEYFKYWLKYIVDCINDSQAEENNSLIHGVYDYINQNFGESIGLTDISDYLNRNPSYLSRFIKQHTGKTFSKILTERRIEEAKKLLKNTNLKLPEISEKVGYPNVRYFTRVFSTQVSMTPSDYRKITAAFIS